MRDSECTTAEEFVTVHRFKMPHGVASLHENFSAFFESPPTKFFSDFISKRKGR